MNELQCQLQDIPYKTGLFRLGLNSRSVIDWNQRHTGAIDPKKAGFVKMIVTNDKKNKSNNNVLLGMRAVGVNSSSMIQTASYLIQNEMSIFELESISHCHPSINEAVLECARMIVGNSIYKPHVWPRSYVKHYDPKQKTLTEAEKLMKYQSVVPGYMEQ